MRLYGAEQLASGLLQRNRKITFGVIGSFVECSSAPTENRAVGSNYFVIKNYMLHQLYDFIAHFESVVVMVQFRHT